MIVSHIPSPHDKVCELRLVRCPLHCGTRVLVRNLAKHQEGCAQRAKGQDGGGKGAPSPPASRTVSNCRVSSMPPSSSTSSTSSPSTPVTPSRQSVESETSAPPAKEPSHSSKDNCEPQLRPPAASGLIMSTEGAVGERGKSRSGSGDIGQGGEVPQLPSKVTCMRCHESLPFNLVPSHGAECTGNSRGAHVGKALSMPPSTMPCSTASGTMSTTRSSSSSAGAASSTRCQVTSPERKQDNTPSRSSEGCDHHSSTTESLGYIVHEHRSGSLSEGSTTSSRNPENHDVSASARVPRAGQEANSDRVHDVHRTHGDVGRHKSKTEGVKHQDSVETVGCRGEATPRPGTDTSRSPDMAINGGDTVEVTER